MKTEKPIETLGQALRLTGKRTREALWPCHEKLFEVIVAEVRRRMGRAKLPPRWRRHLWWRMQEVWQKDGFWQRLERAEEAVTRLTARPPTLKSEAKRG
jgi:hypothetical protein